MEPQPPAPKDAAIERAAQFVRDGTGLLILAGAGIGVDSGLPDFRGDAGFWREYPALRDAGVRLTDIATPASFDADPALVWGFYGHRMGMYRDTAPHDGFRILRKWADAMPDRWWVQTTNVDGQFQKSGFDRRYIHEVHGTLHEFQCSKPCAAMTWSAAKLKPDVDSGLRWRRWPTCPRCGAVARPNVLMFGDEAWVGKHAETQHWKLIEWLDEVERLVIVEVGAGIAIPTLRQFGERLVTRRDAKLIRVNLHDSAVELTGAAGIPMGARAALGEIESAIRSRT